MRRACPGPRSGADFGEAMVEIGGVEQKAHFFALELPHSDACCVRAYPALAQRDMGVQCSAEGGEGLLDQGALLLAKKSPTEDHLSPPSATTVAQCDPMINFHSNCMILIAESGCGVVKIHDHLGNAGQIESRP